MLYCNRSENANASEPIRWEEGNPRKWMGLGRRKGKGGEHRGIFLWFVRLTLNCRLPRSVHGLGSQSRRRSAQLRDQHFPMPFSRDFCDNDQHFNYVTLSCICIGTISKHGLLFLFCLTRQPFILSFLIRYLFSGSDNVILRLFEPFLRF